MLNRILHPKNSLSSVAQEIERGLALGIVYLNDEEITEAGYKIIEAERPRHIYLWAKVFEIAILAIIFSLLVHSGFLGNLSKIWQGVLSTTFIIILAFLIPEPLAGQLHRQRRFITKQSSRTH